MDKLECDLINTAINDIPALREGFYLSSFLIHPHVFHVTCPDAKSQKYEHSHSTFELSLIMEGKISYHINGNKFTLLPGDMVMIPPNQKHYWELHGENTVVFGYMCFISGKGIHPLRQNNQFLNAIQARQYHIRQFEQFGCCVKSINDLLSRNMVFKEDEARSLQILSYIYLFRKLLPNWKDAEKPSKRSVGNSDQKQLIEQVKYYIYDNLSRPICLADLRKNLGLSKDYLNRLFKKNEGIPIGKFITRIKIEQASKMLLITNEDVKTVARQFGFADLDYFSYCFRRNTGKTPTEFRKINQRQ